MVLRLRSLLPALSVVVVCASVACSSAPSTDVEEVAQSSSDALTTDEAVARAEQWVAVKLKYCQAPNGARDYDAACSTYCNRLSNPAWDPYRSDCSGLISWAWGLPAPGRVTGQFSPFQNDITHSIQATDLRAGDAVNNDHHVMLFKEWTVVGKTATFIEEPGCSSSMPYAHELTSNVSMSGTQITVASQGSTYTALRLNAIQLPDAPPAGALDHAACGGLEGWSQDPENKTAHVTVALTFDGPLDKAGVASERVVAADSRSDLCKPLGTCDHGFATPVPNGLRDGKAHTVRAYGIDPKTKVPGELAGGARSFTCEVPAIPRGVRRHVTSPAAMTAWGFDAALDVALEPQAAVDAVVEGDALSATPDFVVGDDGSTTVWVRDGLERRRVVSAASLAAWGMAPKKVSAASLASMTEGRPWPIAPFVMKGSSAPSVWVMDSAPNGSIAPAAPGGYASAPSGSDASASDDAGCSTAGGSAPSRGVWMVASLLALGALARRERRERFANARRIG